MRIGLIDRMGETVIPRGNTEIKAGDRIVMFILTEAVEGIEKMFHSSLEKY